MQQIIIVTVRRTMVVEFIHQRTIIATIMSFIFATALMIVTAFHPEANPVTMMMMHVRERHHGNNAQNEAEKYDYHAFHTANV